MALAIAEFCGREVPDTIMTKFVRDVQEVTRIAIMSDALRISAAWTMVCTSGVSGSSLIDPGGMSVGSTE